MKNHNSNTFKCNGKSIMPTHHISSFICVVLLILLYFVSGLSGSCWICRILSKRYALWTKLIGGIFEIGVCVCVCVSICLLKTEKRQCLVVSGLTLVWTQMFTLSLNIYRLALVCSAQVKMRMWQMALTIYRHPVTLKEWGCTGSPQQSVSTTWIQINSIIACRI